MLSPDKIYHRLNADLPFRTPRAKFLLRPRDDNYGLRWFNRKRYRDIHSLYLIDNQEALFQYMHPRVPSDLRYYRDVFECPTSHHRYSFYIFAITSFDGGIIGWIQFMLDPNRPRLKHIYPIKHNSLVLEVSYAKLFDTGYRNVAGNALKRAPALVLNMDNNCLKNVYLTAYTDTDNVASESVLDKNGFEKLPRTMEYEGDTCNVWVKKIN